MVWCVHAKTNYLPAVMRKGLSAGMYIEKLSDLFPSLIPRPHSQASFPSLIPRPCAFVACSTQGLGTRLSISFLECMICVQVHCQTCPVLFSPGYVWNAVCAIFANCQRIPTLRATQYLTPDMSGANLLPWQPQKLPIVLLNMETQTWK